MAFEPGIMQGSFKVKKIKSYAMACSEQTDVGGAR